ncbi:13619_t:CDS:2, partial [Racocetra persica]
MLLPEAKQKIEIHWPHKCSTLRDVCDALEYLNAQRDEPITPKKKLIYRDLVRQTKNILKRIIKACPDVWRMMDARYEIMQALIRGQCVSLIRTILFEKDDKSPRGIKSRLSKHLHFPRLYAWPLEQKESDLQSITAAIAGLLNSAALLSRQITRRNGLQCESS